MTPQAVAIDNIERAQRDEPFCPACLAPTVPIAEGGQIWLRCSRDAEPHHGIGRLLAFFPLAAHTHRSIVADAFERAA
jgi:hypothetical protein